MLWTLGEQYSSVPDCQTVYTRDLDVVISPSAVIVATNPKCPANQIERRQTYTLGIKPMISKLFRLCPLSAFLVTSFPIRAADPVQLPDGLAITPYAAPHSMLLPLKPGSTDHPDF